MTTVLKPSAPLQVKQINNLTLFKFTDELGRQKRVQNQTLSGVTL